MKKSIAVFITILLFAGCANITTSTIPAEIVQSQPKIAIVAIETVIKPQFLRDRNLYFNVHNQRLTSKYNAEELGEINEMVAAKMINWKPEVEIRRIANEILGNRGHNTVPINKIMPVSDELREKYTKNNDPSGHMALKWYNPNTTIFDYDNFIEKDEYDIIIEIGYHHYELSELYGLKSLDISTLVKAISPSTGEALGRSRKFKMQSEIGEFYHNDNEEILKFIEQFKISFEAELSNLLNKSFDSLGF